MEKQIINVGTLKSLSNLNYSLGKELRILRNSYIHGDGKIPIWDLTNIIPKNVSISSLTAFLSISKVIRDFIGQPIEVRLLWQPEFQGFLADIGFLQIAKEFDLYNWKGMLGGFESNKTSPHTKIFYYSDIPEKNNWSNDEIIEWKDNKRQEIKHSIHFRLSNIFSNNFFSEKWNKNLEGIFNITISELVVNSLLHGRAVAFVGVQRTRTGISTSVCDSGRGFLRSLLNNKSHLENILENSTLKALVYSSFQSKNKIGLFRAINDIILSDGYVNMSSFEGEILWKDTLWHNIMEKEGDLKMKELQIEAHDNYITGFTDLEIFKQGYLRKYDDFLVGSRVSFEIPF
jgi:hypothetical protein